jgi:hypothetical protein
MPPLILPFPADLVISLQGQADPDPNNAIKMETMKQESAKTLITVRHGTIPVATYYFDDMPFITCNIFQAMSPISLLREEERVDSCS